MKVSTIKRSEHQIHNAWYEAYQASINEIDRYFIMDALRKKKEPLSTLQDAVTAQRIVDACEQSANTSSVITL